MDCLFCKIISGSIPSEKIYEDEHVLAFKDIHPLAKTHVLFVHKKHTVNVSEMVATDPDQLLHVFKAIASFAKTNETLRDGLRIVTNQGPYSGQAVFHTHFHVVGGERLKGFGST